MALHFDLTHIKDVVANLNYLCKQYDNLNDCGVKVRNQFHGMRQHGDVEDEKCVRMLFNGGGRVVDQMTNLKEDNFK